ncbi:twin arginine protein translocation system -TatC protein [Thauera humireducens]|jgi:sec-independent protein translocase protein TatC|uniref:Sec-independent protein translocase protein TatC n=1 Tax=Thauera humireducens TaxID=1134435 RepID=A0A127KAJ6_9RHOO|nr:MULTISPECIES: twin-arginine translocase subunit TatC [Thauera]AMO38694.1 twin-arginine protein translocation system subunit TatC [Thauera humireducens]ENO79548.1 Sec-independent protein translocase, TatC subunit [Thauera sp. 63]CAH1745752.1 twin arginine protein translocation system -TatC protein [Thauera humireducens]
MSTQQETFISHLVELRDRLIRALLVVVVVFVCLMPWAGDIYDILAKPMMDTLPEGTHMIATGVVTPFFVPVKVTMMVAFVLALPWVLFQAWAFIAPGLYAHEKRMALPLVAGSTLLFIIGMAFCYFFVFGMVFKFIAEFAPKSIVPAPDIEQYLSFVMSMFIAFGVTFEVPVAVILLVKAGIVDVAKLKEVRPYVIVGAFVIAAIVTPPDVISQLMLAIPMCLLYELGIILAGWMSKPVPAAAESAYVAPSIEDMDRELDRIEASERSDKG